MSHPVHTLGTAPTAAKETLAEVTKNYGFLPNLMGVLAGAPPTLKAYLALGGFFDQTTFTPAERQVVLLTTSFENGCSYCVAAHTVIAGMQKVPAPIVEAIRAGMPIADPKLDALRRFTSEVVTSRGYPSAEARAAFFAAGYGSTQVLEVLLGVTMKTLSNYVNHAADTPLDGTFGVAAWSKAVA